MMCAAPPEFPGVLGKLLRLSGRERARLHQIGTSGAFKKSFWPGRFMGY
jgi:hypothetical protein